MLTDILAAQYTESRFVMPIPSLSYRKHIYIYIYIKNKGLTFFNVIRKEKSFTRFSGRFVLVKELKGKDKLLKYT